MSPLSEPEQQCLLRLARQAIEAAVLAAESAPFTCPEGPLTQQAGAFVTLHKSGRLRGCMGNIESPRPLHQTVCDCARSAALRDPRFDPVSAAEIPHLHIEISVLSPLEEARPDKVEVGRHGLFVSRGYQRGLLLPQVATKYRWDREKFLDETCLKAGLPADAWRRGARIQVFTAQIFAEPASPSRTSHHAA
ncbi:MAG: AmmeMemoRadiSam system protein A [Acidobacteria bacterium]|nr:AmmeMemoRadiSam system protein A [Acidobacteriota bacterium]